MTDIRVIAGRPTADELAIVVAVLSRPEAERTERRESLWAAPQLRASDMPRGWWASGLPR